MSTTPIALFVHDHAALWQTPGEGRQDHDPAAVEHVLAPGTERVLEMLRGRGALFLRELAGGAGSAECAASIGELVAAGLVTSDSFAGLRALVRTERRRSDGRARPGPAPGRWSLVNPAAADRESAVEAQARTLLRRYGVVFRSVLLRETNAAPWRELARVYRRLEARGEIRGGRFVSGMSGEQFATSDAVSRLREVRRTARDERVIIISATDPLNLAGIITPGERVRAVPSSRVAYRDGVPIAALRGKRIRPLAEGDFASFASFASFGSSRAFRTTDGQDPENLENPKDLKDPKEPSVRASRAQQA